MVRLCGEPFPAAQHRGRNGKFDHVLSALPEDLVGQILGLVEAALAATPYTFLRTRLLETHSLSDFEKWDMLKKTEQMGGRKPS